MCRYWLFWFTFNRTNPEAAARQCLRLFVCPTANLPQFGARLGDTSRRYGSANRAACPDAPEAASAHRLAPGPWVEPWAARPVLRDASLRDAPQSLTQNAVNEMSTFPRVRHARVCPPSRMFPAWGTSPATTAERPVLKSLTRLVAFPVRLSGRGQSWSSRRITAVFSPPAPSAGRTAQVCQGVLRMRVHALGLRNVGS
jgi:hypothetical protein